MTSGSDWYKDATIYQIHVRAFQDSNGDGIGDFRGLTSKLDYIEDLGVTAVWLQPFYPSPLRDDGYDIADYRDIHPDYGTLRDFKAFLKEAHRREIRVITELVINHTSDQHPWFQRARRARPGSRHRDFYVWSDSPDKYAEARIIFKDFEHSNWVWDPVAHAYFWHRFYSHQPDLNFDSPAVRRAVFQLVDFWFGMGVDGLRLDAVPYLYEREGTNCENLPETHAFLKQLRKRVDDKYGDRMLLAEANQWPEDAVAYFGEGDECHMAFHFPVMPRLFMGIQMEDRFPIVDILNQTPPIPDSTQWAIFLRNHDELTLEMVTDEDRDYMYRVYAQDPRARVNLGIRRRLAPLMGRNRRRIELMNSLLLSLPGTPAIYYGDEIGMGDNIYLGDRNGVRTPMQWSADRNAGFSRSNPQQLYLPVIIDPEYHYEALNVEAQQGNANSLLWYMKRLLALRKESAVFGRGTIEFLQPDNHKILAFVREYQDARVLIVANLSRFVQCVELDLAKHRGMVPVEMFGGMRFPFIGESPYFVTLSPHAFYWLDLQPATAAEEPAVVTSVSQRHVSVDGPWHALLSGKQAKLLERMLPGYLKTCRWFGGKARQVLSVRIAEAVAVPTRDTAAHLVFVEVTYADGDPETYLLPLGLAVDDQATEVSEAHPQAVIAQVTERSPDGDRTGLLYDALYEPRFAASLAALGGRKRRLKGTHGEVAGFTTRGFQAQVREASETLQAEVLGAEQSNTSCTFGDRLIMKVLRRVDAGVNPDLEIGRFLTERTAYKDMAPVAGGFEYRRSRGEPVTLGIIHRFVPNEGDAWQYTLDALGRYFEQVAARARAGETEATPRTHIVERLSDEIPPAARDRIGLYLESARMLGDRTASLHLALASRTDDPAFAPEAFSTMYQRSLYQSVRSRAEQSLSVLDKRLRHVPKEERALAREVLNARAEISRRLRSLLDRKIKAVRTRCHGDYHLGQVLYTGRDFVILDFEGEPARPLGERRLKRSPLRDVAGMLRSFHYASVSALLSGRVRSEDMASLEQWAGYWCAWVGTAFLQAYVETAGSAAFLPKTADERRVLLDTHLLDKALYELAYELNNRPDWVRIPLRGIAQLVDRDPGS